MGGIIFWIQTAFAVLETVVPVSGIIAILGHVEPGPVIPGVRIPVISFFRFRSTPRIEKAEALKDSEAWAETSAALVELQKEWKTIGPVARKYSDEIWKKFTATCDEFFNKKREVVKETRNERHRARGEKVLASGDRDKLVRMYTNLQQEIKTAENNILFFTGKSKSGNKLVEDMQKKIDGLKKQLVELEEKINQIDAAE